MSDELTRVAGLEVRTLDARDWCLVQWHRERIPPQPRRTGAPAGGRALGSVAPKGGARRFYWVMLAVSLMAVSSTLL